MRHAAGPPLGHLIYGQWPEIIRNEAGIVQREWAKKYGPTVRAVGPVGVERMTFLSPEAMHKILVSDCFEYPRVRCLISFYLRCPTADHVISSRRSCGILLVSRLVSGY